MRRIVVAPVRSLLKELGYMAPAWCEALNEDLLRELDALERELGDAGHWFPAQMRAEGDDRWSQR